jgi:hypothetical protein
MIVLFFALIVAVSASPLQVRVHRPASNSWHRTQCGGSSGTADIPSKWGLEISSDKQPLPEFPRPMMVRGPSSTSPSLLRDIGDQNNWANLNGLWQWEKASSTTPPFNKTLNGSILVPFPVESCLSGVAPKTSEDIVLDMWYRLQFDISFTKKLLLHFEAVDWSTLVWVNGHLVGNHTGGYDAFSCDVTKFVFSSKNELLVYVYDPSDSGPQPNGKQRISAISSPGGDTYTPSSGIWQTVWLEEVPETYISDLRLDYDLSSVTITASVSSTETQDLAFTVVDNSKVVATANGQSNKAVTIKIPSPKLWSMDSPFLYDLKVTIKETTGGDQILSYFGLRTFKLIDQKHPITPPTGPQTGIDRPDGDMQGSPFTLDKADPNLCWGQCNSTKGCLSWSYAIPGCDAFKVPTCWLKSGHQGTSPYKCRISGDQGSGSSIVKRPVLNDKFTFLAGWLDQSWWPDGQYTAPSDDALKSDITAVKTFGLNMVRLHQKVNPKRWYYHADTVGVAIMQDAVQKYGRASQATILPFVHDLVAMIEGRGNHPCIIQWVTFNEGDCIGVFNTKPYTVQDIVALAKKTDWQGRPVDTDSGPRPNTPPYKVGDVNDIHDYPYPKHPMPSETKYAMIGEFGGIGAFITGKEWVPSGCYTYLKVDTPSEEAATYVKMAGQLLNVTLDVSASVYVQITDLELECDGFLTYDRTNKFSAADTKAIHDANRALIFSSNY